MEKFGKLGLGQKMLEVLSELKFEVPTEIQEKAIPLVMAGKDVIGGSATGSGKTLVFASPIVEKLMPNGEVQALIMTPTRELAEQVADSIKLFSKNKKLEVLSIYGGVSIENQIKRIKYADVIVGTPGRILDHIKRATLDLSHVKFLVLDEVDRMFDMGFHEDVEKIIAKCPKERQTMLFSATISGDIDHLAKKHTRNATEVAVESYIDASKLKQIYYDVPNNMKFSLLVHLLNNEKSGMVMVFCNTRRNVDFVENNLKKNHIDAIAIHGGLTQNKRTRIMGDFNGGGVHVLVCTDVAARGLDISGVSHVYNYDLPAVSNDYIHRIGRTARAGNEGIAISLLSSRDYQNFEGIIRNDSLKIAKTEMPKIQMAEVKTSFGSGRFGDRDGRSGGRSFSRGPSRGGPSRGGPRRDSRGPSRGGPRRDGPSRGGSSGGGRSFNRSGSSSGGRSFNRSGPSRGGSSSGGRSFNRGPSRDRESGPRRDGRRTIDQGRGNRSFSKSSESQGGSGDGERRKARNPFGRNGQNRSRSRRDGERKGSKDGFRGSRGGRSSSRPRR